jgi:hypothetical protein
MSIKFAEQSQNSSRISQNSESEVHKVGLKNSESQNFSFEASKRAEVASKFRRYHEILTTHSTHQGH